MSKKNLGWFKQPLTRIRWKVYKSKAYWDLKQLIYNDTIHTNCSICGILMLREQAQVHHKKNITDYPHLAFEYENLQVVCKKCHKEIHNAKY